MAAEDEREVVRVRVKKCEGALPAESRSFAVDPQITSLDVLHHILIRAFELDRKCNFGVSYLCRDHGDSNHGEGEVYLTLQLDLDLDTAFARSSKPYLLLKMDIRPAEDSPLMEGWDVISPKDVIGSDLLSSEKRGLAAAALPLTQSLLSQVGRTLSRVQQALSWSSSEEVKPFKPPLSDSEFHSFLNSQGQLCHPEQLRLRIYHGGVEPSLRKVVWRYLLNVYPDGLTGQERMDYMRGKAREYERMKREWREHVAPGDLDLIRSSVTKDVLRTDRTHPYYAGSEDNPHLTALADLLTTYAVSHPQVSYCQGMSDLASPILAVMDNEAHAYVCFCGLMRRLEGNFAPDGRLMSLKFRHLQLLLERCDPELYAHLRRRGAHGLLFCYRWLLLDLKREFPFEHALRMLEVSWSSLPPDPPETDVQLRGPPKGAGSPGRGGASRCDAMRGEGLECRGRGEGEGGSVSGEGDAMPPPLEKRPGPGEFRYYSAHEGDGSDLAPPPVGGPEPEDSGHGADGREHSSPDGHREAALSSSPPSTRAAPEIRQAPSTPATDGRPASPGTPSPGRASPLSASCETAQASPATPTPAPAGSGFSVGAASSAPAPTALPPPHVLGGGNPFMLFLCVALLLEQRAQVLRADLDHNELAMHFDRLVRRHNLAQVLHRARTLFADYLQSEVRDSEQSEGPASLVRPLPLQPPSGSATLNSTYKLTNTVPSTPPVCPLQPPS